MVFEWLTPLDVFDRYPQLVPFTDFMASWNTQIRRLGEYSGPTNQAELVLQFGVLVLGAASYVAGVVGGQK